LDASQAFADVIRMDTMDKPALIYLQRCHELIERDPDEDWDGIMTLNDK
jgi:hypothetical protein